MVYVHGCQVVQLQAGRLVQQGGTSAGTGGARAGSSSGIWFGASNLKAAVMN